MPSVRLLIKGKVQGVCYRASALETAVGLSLTGWVRNTTHGNVEAIATGPQDALQHFIDWCRQGPPDAVVTDVDVEPMTETSFPDFSIRRG